MDWPTRKRAWSDSSVADSYDRRRFGSALGRRKHTNDVALVARLLARCGSSLRVLDVPTGTGRLIGDLCAQGLTVVGLDLSPQMISVAQRPASGRFLGFVLGDAEQLPLADASFDAIVSLRFLFHVRDERTRRRILEEFGRVAEWTVGQVRSEANLKHWGRRFRNALGGGRKFRPTAGREALRLELAAAGLELVLLRPVSRLFSDKALFLARSRRPVRAIRAGDRDAR